MKTNNFNLSNSAVNGLNGVQLVYVLDCIKNSTRAKDENRTFANDLEAITFFFECFEKEYNHEYNKKMCPNLQRRIKEWIAGLPSCFNCYYSNYDIINCGIKWGKLSGFDGFANERKNETFVNGWFSILALRAIQTALKLGYNLKKHF